MPKCHFWSDYKECNNGEDCLYLHESNAIVCPDYISGFCIEGPNCPNKHRKRRICENYLVGFCSEGPSCKYGHPKPITIIRNKVKYY